MLLPQSPKTSVAQSSQPDEIQTLHPSKEEKLVIEASVQRKSPSPKKISLDKKAKEGAHLTDDGEDTAKDHIQLNMKNAHQPSTGPASRAAHGSSNSIPYIDCSDVDSEYDIHRALLVRSQSQTNDNDEIGFHCSNGIYQTDDYSKRSKLRQQISSVRSSSNIIEEYIDDDSAGMSFYAGGSPKMPRHSSLIDEMFNGPGSRSPLAAPLSPSSKGSSPNMSFNRTGSSSYISANAYNKNNGVVIPEDNELVSQSYGYTRYSPSLESAHIQKLKAGYRNHSDTDPFILSPVSSTPVTDHKAEEQRISHLSKMAALEAKMMSNGIFDTRQHRCSPVLRPATLVQEQMCAVPMTDGSTSSGSESSDTDSDIVDSFSHPLVYGNPIVLSSSPMPRNNYSFGSLQLEEYAEEMHDEDTVLSFSDEDGAHIFRC